MSSTPTDTTAGPRLMRIALQAAGAGHWVFPLRPRSKKPAVPAWETAATTDPDRITVWWRRAPYNVGIACGPSRLLVVDLDTPHDSPTTSSGEHRTGRDVLAVLAEEAGEPFPAETYTVATPSGGQHLYFAAPDEPELRSTIGHLGPLVDTRGGGGYVVAAGSVLREGRYRLTYDAPIAPLPQWIIGLLTPHPVSASSNLELPPERAAAYLAAIVRRETEAVAQAVTGQRHHTLLRAAGVLGRLVGGQELDYAVAENTLRQAVEGHLGRDGFTPAEAEATIRSGLAWGIQRPRHITHTHSPTQD